MKILFVSHQAEFIYGGEIVTIEMIRGLRGEGISAEFASPEGAYQDRVREVAPVHTIPTRQFSRRILQLPEIALAAIRTHRALRNLVRSESFTHLHAQSLKAHVFCWWLGVTRTVPVIWHHHDIMPLGLANSLWLRFLALGARRIVVPSNATRKALEAAGVPPRKISMVWNGFPVEKWTPRPLATDSFRAIFVGELSLRKGADLIPVLADRMDVPITVVGEGLSDPVFAQKVRHDSEGKSVEYLGRRNDVPSQLQRAHVIVVPSREDPLPTVVIEAALSGLPCVAAAVGGMPELVEDGVTGFLVTTVEEMADKVRWLASHPEEWTKFSRAARESAERKFSIRRVVQDLKAIYSGT